MTREEKQMLGLLSFLMMYPNDDYWRSLEAFEPSTAALPAGDATNCITAFLAYLESQPRIVLQENYTAAFDMNPSTTLNLTYHLWGDNENRADALVRLEQVYRDAGYERTSGELPDCLPLMLEFLSICPDARGVEHLWACLRELDAYLIRLEREAPAYAALLQPLARMASSRTPNKTNALQAQVPAPPRR